MPTFLQKRKVPVAHKSELGECFFAFKSLWSGSAFSCSL
jgi:hypothetical protein